MTLGEILDQAIRLYRRNFIRFVGIIAIPYIPLTLIQTGMTYLSTNSLTSIQNIQRTQTTSPFGILPGTYWIGLLGMIVVGFLEFILVRGVAGAALTRAVADSYTGQSGDILGSYGKIGSSWARLLGALLLFALIGFVVLIGGIFIPCVGWLIGPGLFIFLSLVVGPLLAPIVVLERQDITASLRRAWDLARSRFWWLLGFAICLSLLAQLIITIPTYLVAALLQSVFANQSNLLEMMVWRTVIQTLVQMLGGLLYLPLQLCAMTVVYFDLRVRAEGLDLAMQAAANAGTETNIIALTETSPKPSAEVITGAEVGQFMLVSIATVALYIILMGVIFAASLALVSAIQ
jgi:hypothetical protein